MPAGPHEHRHVGPRDAVLEVGPAEQVGEVLGLGAVGVVGEEVDPARVGVGGGRGGEPLARGPEGRLRQPGGDVLRRTEDAVAETAGGAEHERRGPPAVGAAELVGELEDAADVGAAERVDGLVRVTDDRQVAAVTGQRPQQRDLGRVGVLVLVDEDVAQLLPDHVAHRLVGVLEQPDGGGDQAGVVEQVLVGRDHVVLLHEGGRRHELRHPFGLAEPAQRLGAQTFLLGPGHHLGDLRGEAARADRAAQPLGPLDRLRLAGQDLLEDDVLLGRGQQPERLVVELGR